MRQSVLWYLQDAVGPGDSLNIRKHDLFDGEMGKLCYQHFKLTHYRSRGIDPASMIESVEAGLCLFGTRKLMTECHISLDAIKMELAGVKLKHRCKSRHLASVL